MTTASGTTEKPRFDAGEFASAVAEALNALPGEGGWLVDASLEYQYNDYRVLSGPNGERVALSHDSWKNRIDAGGEYPRLDSRHRPVDSRTEVVRAGFTAGRGAKAAAAEIARRVLPAYRINLAAHRAAMADHERRLDAKAALAQRIARVVGEEPRGDDKNCISLYGNTLGDGTWGSITCSDDSVHIDLSGLTADQAEAALRAIRQQSRKTEASR